MKNHAKYSKYLTNKHKKVDVKILTSTFVVPLGLEPRTP